MPTYSGRRPLLAAVVIGMLLLASGTLLSLRRNDFATLISSLLTGSAEGLTLGILGVAALLCGVAGWSRRDAPSHLRRVSVVSCALALVLAAIAWSRSHAGISTRPTSFVSDGDTLSGTITSPRDFEARLPGIVIAQGSLRVSHRAYQPLAIALARAGYVVLNYDKRGIGRSGGADKLDENNNAGEPYLRQLGRDLAQASRALRRDARVDPGRIGYWAVSQGGWSVPLAASDDRAIAFALIVSGPAVSSREEGVFSELSGEESDHFGRRPPARPFAEIDAIVDTVAPGGFDPRASLGTLQIPVRWIMGAWDNSVPVSKSLAVVDSLAAEGRPFRAWLVPEGNHGLMVARGPNRRFTPYWRASVWDTTLVWLRDMSAGRR